jgi:hypothetical protein
LSAELIRKNYAELNNSVLSFTEELKKIPISTLIKPESGAIVEKGFTTNFDNFAHSYCSQSERMTTQVCPLFIFFNSWNNTIKDVLRFVVNSLFLCINSNTKLVNSLQIEGHP